jgi:hypothetical protein
MKLGTHAMAPEPISSTYIVKPSNQYVHLLTVARQRLSKHVMAAIITTDNLPRGTSVRDLHKAFHVPYVHYYITKSCRQQADVVQNHENENVCYIGQGEAPHRKYKRLKLGGGHVYYCSSV